MNTPFRRHPKLHALGWAVACLTAPAAYAQSTPDVQKQDTIVITGSRIKSAAITATSPVSQLSAEEIALSRSVTVEDFSVKLPALAGGVNSSSVGSDALGAQTLDLRGLGQNRTLVLVNGTRAVPFSFRNAVDVNFVPAPLLRRVDVLTGGAAAVYGADAVAGVVNFVINDNYRGIQVGANTRTAKGGAAQSGINLTGGWSLGSGSLVGYAEMTERQGLRAGERSWATANTTGIAGVGGNFTDVASGRKFSFDSAGNFTTTPQTTNYVPQYLLVQPMSRTNLSLFGKFDLTDNAQLYGRYMFSNVETKGGASPGGQQPVLVSGDYNISATNPFLTPQIRSQLTFVNGQATVNVQRSLGEAGTIFATNDRVVDQVQVGLKGTVFTPNIEWDVYTQRGKSKETVVVTGDANRAAFTANINNINIFGPYANLTGIAQDFSYGNRVRIQEVTAASLSGDTTGLFKLPAGPLGFAVGVEMRKESGDLAYSPTLAQSFQQSVPAAPTVSPFFKAKDFFVEARVPILAGIPLVRELSLEAALRKSDYNKSVGASNSYDSDKLGLSWAITEDVRLRATSQTTIREPNFGEFANPVASIPFRNLVTVARLNPRYRGDPCVLGTGNAAQCARFGAPAVGSYNSLDPNLLTGGYFFGGNQDIRAEKGKSSTLGLVFTPRFAKGLSVTLDAYNIKINDAVGVIQPVDALNSCYILDPRADNPLCQAVTRDPATGRIKDGFPVDRNLALIQQKGLDIDAAYTTKVNAGFVGNLTVRYQAATVRDYIIQRSPVVAPLDCKGTYGSACSSDSVSLVSPAYRHRFSAANAFGPLTTELAWKRIGKVRDSAVGSTDVIDAQNYFDVNFSYKPASVKGLSVNFGVDNIADKQPPTPRNFGQFNTYTDTYNVVGRTYGVSLTYKVQ